MKTLEEARRIDAETLRDKASAFRNAGLHRWGLCVDGTFLPDQPNRMLCENRRLQIPVMIGNTDDEFANVFPAKTYEEFETMGARVWATRRTSSWRFAARASWTRPP